MKILISAYSVNPYTGSESGVAWSFIKELSKNHTLYILTRKRNKTDLEKEVANLGCQDRVFLFYFDIPFFSDLYKVAGITEHLYYLMWQLALPLKAKAILDKVKIDLVHHITLGAFRYPSLLVFFNKPFIFGPIGGGENYPFSIKKSFPVKLLALELIRDLVNRLFLFNPLLLYTFEKSTLIACRTRQTLDLIPQRYHHKCIIEMGISVSDTTLSLPPSNSFDLIEKNRPFRILYAGRPVYWKGLHFVIQAFSLVLQKIPDVEFNISGPGNNDWAKAVAARHGVLDKINWLGKVEKSVLEDLYKCSDLLAFPSLREAGGTVAIEALSFSLPVLCLDLGGPCQVVNKDWGIVLETKNKTQADLVQEIADTLIDLYHSRDKLIRMKENSLLEVSKYSMSRIVARLYNNSLVVSATGKFKEYSFCEGL